MVRTDNKILALVGINCTGDLGPWTFYRSSRRQLVYYARVPALSPASTRQKIQRDRWRCAAKLWALFPPARRAAFERVAKKTGVLATGYNLWVYYHTTRDAATLLTLQRQAGVDAGIYA
jgi:hypothetical protein